MRVLAYDLYPDDSFRPGETFRYASIEELLSSSDVISLPLVLPPLTAGPSSAPPRSPR